MDARLHGKLEDQGHDGEGRKNVSVVSRNRVGYNSQFGVKRNIS